MDNMRSTAAIILAAGSSSRMGSGRHKLLLLLDERPVLAHVIEAALASQARPIVVILGHEAGKVRAVVAAYMAQQDSIVVENPDYLQGMSTSMRVGIARLLKGKSAEVEQRMGQIRDEEKGQQPHFDVDSALIMLGDQPLITAQVLDALISARKTSGKPIVASLYDGKRGSPTLFATSLFAELMEVSGDEGGRTVLERHREEVEFVELGDVAASYDVDTWEAYLQVVEAWQKKKASEPQTGNE
ncbi:MAG: nucleotidyltransferase family protein [Chloroflexota bacterium]|nr:nucleotidyltransferase family protein [Chloroflexota bacterium]